MAPVVLAVLRGRGLVVSTCTVSVGYSPLLVGETAYGGHPGGSMFEVVTRMSGPSVACPAGPGQGGVAATSVGTLIWIYARQPKRQHCNVSDRDETQHREGARERIRNINVTISILYQLVLNFKCELPKHGKCFCEHLERFGATLYFPKNLAAPFWCIVRQMNLVEVYPGPLLGLPGVVGRA